MSGDRTIVPQGAVLCLATVFLTLPSLGCPSDSCDQTLVGQKLRVHVTGSYEPEHPFYDANLDNAREAPCGAIDGIGPGASFSFWIMDILPDGNGSGCGPYRAFIRSDMQDVPGVTISPAQATTVIDNHMGIVIDGSTHQVTTAAGCSGSWGFNLKWGPGRPAALSDGGGEGDAGTDALSGSDLPTGLLERWFVPSADPVGVCARCSDTFVARWSVE